MMMSSNQQFEKAKPALSTTGKRIIGVQQILEWAFGNECARLEPDTYDGGRSKVSLEYVMIQRAALGCRIDGGGRSEPHEDAEVVAAIVANLSDSHGGWRMACRVAELARVGLVPDWLEGAKTHCVPQAWRKNRHGWHAASEKCGVEHVRRKGRIVTVERRWCPVTFTPTAQQIARHRREYLDWWGALLEIRSCLECVHLTQHTMSDTMPPMTPWKKTS